MIIRHKVKEPNTSNVIRSKLSKLISSVSTNMERRINNTECGVNLCVLELRIRRTLYRDIHAGHLIPLNNSMTMYKFSRFKHDYCKP